MAKARTKTRSRGRTTALYIPVAVLLVLFACIFGVSVFLRVTTIEVRGAGRYSAEDVTMRAGVKKGDNLLLLSMQSIADKLKAEMPYIENVTVRPKLPDTVVIDITERVPVAVVYAQGKGYIIDAGCWVVDTLAGPLDGLIRIDGITPVDPEPGKYLSLGDIPTTRLGALETVLKAICAAGITEGAGSLDISNIATISFEYLGRFTVVLGTVEQLEDKLTLLVRTVAGFEDNVSGKIILSVPGEARLLDSA